MSLDTSVPLRIFNTSVFCDDVPTPSEVDIGKHATIVFEISSVRSRNARRPDELADSLNSASHEARRLLVFPCGEFVSHIVVADTKRTLGAQQVRASDLQSSISCCPQVFFVICNTM